MRRLPLLLLWVSPPRAWKRHLAENAHLPGAGPEVLLAALTRVPDEVLDERPGVAGVPAAAPAHLRRSA